MRMRSGTLLVLLLAACGVATGDPLEGVYLAQRNGLATFYWQVVEDGASLAITDLFGQGYHARRAGGALTLGGDGDGDGDGDGEIEIGDPGRIIIRTPEETLVLRRIAMTDEHFPFAPRAGLTEAELLEGDWDIREYSLDPVTGERMVMFDGSLVFVDVFDLQASAPDRLSFVDSNGIFFEGVSAGGRDLVFRSFNQNAQALDGYGSIPGSMHNFDRDILGFARFSGVNRFDVLLLVQTLSAVSPAQFLLQIEGERVDPLLEGDADLNGVLDAEDRAFIEAAAGLDSTRPGYRIVADLDGNGLVDLRDLDRFDGRITPEIDAGPWLTGTWYDPQRDGEGFHLFVLDDERALVTWYSYDPEGGQAWFTGLGRVVGNSVEITEMLATRGAEFGDGFDADAVLREPWGAVRFHFEDCLTASVTFAGPVGEFGNGGQRLQRLTVPEGVDCVELRTGGTDSGRYTAVWFDPERSGEGWFIEQLDADRVLVTWYTYDLEGGSMWLIGVGTIEDGVLVVPDLRRPEGGVFGPDFDPDAIERPIWGSLEFEVTGCGNGRISYTPLDPAFGSATRSVTVLAGVAGLGCEP